MSDHPPSTGELAKRLLAPVRITEQSWPEGTVPVVTIRCITYNHVQYIRDAIEGFLMQETTFPVEILVHDDASTDGTADIVRDYQAKYPRLFKTILQKENQFSKGSEANIKMREAIFGLVRGEFIAMCEGDDYWTDARKLEKQVAILESDEGCVLCFHDAYILNTRGEKEIRQQMLAHVEQTKFTLIEIMRPWFIPTASIVLRARVLRGLSEWAINCQSGDIPLLLHCALHGHFIFLKGPMSVYRVHPTGMSAGHVGINVIAGRANIYELFNIYTKRRYERELRRALEMEIRLHAPDLYESEMPPFHHWRYYAAYYKKRLRVFLGLGRSS